MGEIPSLCEVRRLPFRGSNGKVIREGTVYGNDYEPFKGHRKPISMTEAGFRKYVEERLADPVFREQALTDLRGKHLLCWCKQSGPERSAFCHARVWLEAVNRAQQTREEKCGH